MDCERWRELLSAQLDGEDDPLDRAGVDEHLGGCAGCRRWLDAAARVNRLTRTGTASVPDLSAAILDALPVGSAQPGIPAARPARRRPTTVLFVALALIGAVQLILSLAQIGDGAAQSHTHPAGVSADPGHLWHESAAWNVSVGAGFLLLALRRIRPTGLVPMLSAFVGTLVLLSMNDLTAGRVDGSRLTSHGFVIAGYLIVLALSRLVPEPAGPPGDHRSGGRGSGWRARFDDGDPAAPTLRLIRGGRPGTVTARHDRAA